MNTWKKRITEILLIFLLNILIIGIIQSIPQASAAVYKQGSSGAVVKQIQTKLKNWGYYSDGIDGIYGSKTVAAVKYFQSKNGLTADGVCGANTLKALGISGGSSSSSSSTSGSKQGDLNLLSRIISAEARGEPYIGQIAIGGVVLNRVKHPSFPHTISGVIYQPGAFTAVSDGQFNQPATDSAKRAAQEAMNGYDASGGAIYYYNPKTATNQWIRSRPVIKTIGEHVFCK